MSVVVRLLSVATVVCGARVRYAQSFEPLETEPSLMARLVALNAFTGSGSIARSVLWWKVEPVSESIAVFAQCVWRYIGDGCKVVLCQCIRLLVQG